MLDSINNVTTCHSITISLLGVFDSFDFVWFNN